MVIVSTYAKRNEKTKLKSKDKNHYQKYHLKKSVNTSVLFYKLAVQHNKCNFECTTVYTE